MPDSSVSRPNENGGLCYCGCGEPAPLAQRNYHEFGVKKGEPLQFVKGHNWRGKHRPEFANNRAGADNSNWKGGEPDHNLGYRLVTAPDHPNAYGGRYMLEHRLVAEEKLGRYLRPDEVVVHIDGDRANNDPANLEVMTRAELIRRNNGG